MPNYKLSSTIKEHIKDHAIKLTNRRVAYAQSDFPLTTAGLQYRLMRAAHLNLLHELEATGYDLAPKTTNTWIALPRSEAMPVQRSVAIEIFLPEPIHQPRVIYSHFYNELDFKTARDTTKLHQLRLDPCEPEHAEDIAALVKWAHAAVREKRLQEITLWAVQKVLDMCQTSAHLLAAWPLLATLVTDPEWRSRLRHPPKGLHKWAPNANEMAWLLKPIRAAEVVLTSARMTEEYKPEPGIVRAEVRAWERLPRDNDYQGA